MDFKHRSVVQPIPSTRHIHPVTPITHIAHIYRIPFTAPYPSRHIAGNCCRGPSHVPLIANVLLCLLPACRPVRSIVQQCFFCATQPAQGRTEIGPRRQAPISTCVLFVPRLHVVVVVAVQKKVSHARGGGFDPRPGHGLYLTFMEVGYTVGWLHECGFRCVGAGEKAKKPLEQAKKKRKEKKEKVPIRYALPYVPLHLGRSVLSVGNRLPIRPFLPKILIHGIGCCT